MTVALFAIAHLLAASTSASAAPSAIELNEISLANPPAWLRGAKVKSVIEKAEHYLEWDIRKVQATWHPDQAEFQRGHGQDASVLAYTTGGADHSLHFGPRVNETNFDMVFAHELTHVIVFQKYKSAIPKWLEEGLANYVARSTAPKGSQHSAFQTDYAWLARQPALPVEQLLHPFTSIYVPGTRSDQARYHYLASTAAIEFISTKCDIEQLLQLSVGKSIKGYLATFCSIGDLDGELQSWIKRKGKLAGSK